MPCLLTSTHSEQPPIDLHENLVAKVTWRFCVRKIAWFCACRYVFMGWKRDTPKPSPCRRQQHGRRVPT